MYREKYLKIGKNISELETICDRMSLESEDLPCFGKNISQIKAIINLLKIECYMNEDKNDKN